MENSEKNMHAGTGAERVISLTPVAASTAVVVVVCLHDGKKTSTVKSILFRVNFC